MNKKQTFTPRTLLALLSLMALSFGCGEGGNSSVSERSTDPSGGAGQGGEAGNSGQGGASGQGGEGGAGLSGVPVAGAGGASVAGQGGSGGEIAQFCGSFVNNPPALSSKEVPSAQACAERPPVPLACDENSSWVDCLSQRLWTCGPKCGGYCAKLVVGADGCATTLLIPDFAGPAPEVECVLDILSKERLSPPDGAGEIVIQIGACSVC